MPLQIKVGAMKNDTLGFFKKFFPEAAIAEVLPAGATYTTEVGFFAVHLQATFSNGQSVGQAIVLPVSTTSLLKGVCSQKEQNLAKSELFALLCAVGEKVKDADLATVSDPAPKKLGDLLNPSIKIESELEVSDDPVGAYTPPVKKAAPKKVPKNQVVALKEANALGQKVRGSSSGSVYITVALNDHIRIAARQKGGQLSLRAEGKISFDESQRFASLGFSNHGSYLSIHLGLQSITPSRALGALLFGLEIPFDHIYTNYQEIPFHESV